MAGMTTIATDGKTMAGDGQTALAEGHVTVLTKSKLHHLPDGSVIGCAGNTVDILRAVAWLKSGREGKPPKLAEVGILQLMPDGSLFYWNEELEPHQWDVPCAIGTGGELALGAMLAGASPKKAVEIACQRDPMSGGKISELRPK
jgi:ATP-dependent protease HslVU (ClpYQ) peptidase subunit